MRQFLFVVCFFVLVSISFTLQGKDKHYIYLQPYLGSNCKLDSIIEEHSPESRTSYQVKVFDADGRLFQWKFGQAYDRIFEIYTFSYDKEKGYLENIKYTSTPQNKVMTSQFTSSSSVAIGSKNLDEKIKVEIDHEGNTIRLKKNGTIPYMDIVLDDNGLIVKTKFYYADETDRKEDAYTQTIFVYDGIRLKKQMITDVRDEKITKTIECEYDYQTFDNCANWKKRTYSVVEYNSEKQLIDQHEYQEYRALYYRK